MRRKSITWETIEAACWKQSMNPKQLFERAKVLLELYRRLCWKTRARAEDFSETITDFSSSDLQGALVYLETFVPDKQKESFQSRVESLFETKQLIDLVDTAMMRVKDFPDYGDEFFKIISVKYLDRFKYTESEVLEFLNMERSTYYDKKKDAILVFAYCFWCGAIPKYKAMIESGNRMIESDFPDEF